MKAAFVEKPGPADTIQFGELRTPKPKGTEALVRVNAVAVNPIDTYVRSGMVKMPIPLPYIPGADVAGVVEAVGPDCKGLRSGMRIWGSNQGLLGRQGVFAEFAAIEEQWLYPTPDGVSDEDAAAGALVGITSHLGLVQKAKVKAGEIVFVNGGAGGVGSTVTQMAKALGAVVATTVGSDENAEIARSLGADCVINYKTENVDERLRAFAPEGVNVWWETLREPDFDRTVGFLRPRGRMILMAGREARAPFPVGPFYVKDCSLFGFAMFNATPDEQRESALDMNRWMADGKLRPRIGRRFKLSETAAAHRLQEENTLQKAGTLSGKIVLTP